MAVWLTVIWGLSGLAGQPEAGSLPEEALNESLDRWSSASADIWSYDVTLVTTHETVDRKTGNLSLVNRFTCRHRFLHKMWRVDRLKVEYFFAPPPGETEPLMNDENIAMAFDGKQIRVCNEPGKIAAILPQSQFNVMMLGGPLYHELYLATDGGDPYVQNIRLRPGATVSTTPRGCIIDAPPAAKVTITRNKSRLRVELQKDVGFLPTVVHWTKAKEQDGKELSVIRIENVYKRWPEGIWAPERAVKSLFFLTPEQENSVLSKVTTVVTTAHFNVEIDPRIFTFEFPEGVIVYDAKEKRNYIAVQGGKRDYDAYRQLVLKQQSERVAHATSSSRSFTLRTFVVGANVFALAMAAWFLWRRRHNGM